MAFLRTRVTLRLNDVRPKEGETLREAVAREAVVWFRAYYEGKNIYGSTLVEINVVDRYVVEEIVWE